MTAGCIKLQNFSQTPVCAAYRTLNFVSSFDLGRETINIVPRRQSIRLFCIAIACNYTVHSTVAHFSRGGGFPGPDA